MTQPEVSVLLAQDAVSKARSHVGQMERPGRPAIRNAGDHVCLWRNQVDQVVEQALTSSGVWVELLQVELEWCALLRVAPREPGLQLIQISHANQVWRVEEDAHDLADNLLVVRHGSLQSNGETIAVLGVCVKFFNFLMSS